MIVLHNNLNKEVIIRSEEILSISDSYVPAKYYYNHLFTTNSVIMYRNGETVRVIELPRIVIQLMKEDEQ